MNKSWWKLEEVKLYIFIFLKKNNRIGVKK